LTTPITTDQSTDTNLLDSLVDLDIFEKTQEDLDRDYPIYPPIEDLDISLENIRKNIVDPLLITAPTYQQELIRHYHERELIVETSDLEKLTPRARKLKIKSRKRWIVRQEKLRKQHTGNKRFLLNRYQV
jgi:hypothetical protein